MSKKQRRTEQDKKWDAKIGATLAFIRARDALQSQTVFSKRLGISRGHLANIESGRTPLSATLGWKFCRDFNCNPNWIIVAANCRQRNEFPHHLSPEKLTKLEEIMTSSQTALFREVWPPLAWLVSEIECQEENITGKEKVRLDIPPALLNAADVQKITTLPELIASLRELTKRHGLKADLANHCQVTRQAVDQWLRQDAKSKPSAEAVFAALDSGS